MSTFTARIHALVIERAELYADMRFPPWPCTPEEQEAARQHNNAIRVRILETYAEVQDIICEQLREETK